MKFATQFYSLFVVADRWNVRTFCREKLTYTQRHVRMVSALKAKATFTQFGKQRIKAIDICHFDIVLHHSV